MSKLYILAYDKAGNQILGNLDGQGVIYNARNYARTNQFKRLSTFPTLHNRVAEYRLVDERDKVVAVVKHQSHTRSAAK